MLADTKNFFNYLYFKIETLNKISRKKISSEGEESFYVSKRNGNKLSKENSVDLIH